MIRQRIGRCRLCGPDSRDQPLITDLCKPHYWQERDKINATKRTEKKIIHQPKSIVIPKINTGLDIYFLYHIEHNEWICENCGDPVDHYCYEIAKCAQAHILPKAIFKTVLANLDNHLTLCSRGSRNNCHYSFDFSWDRASRMPVIEIAKVRFLKFGHILSEREVSKLPGIFSELLIAC